MKLHPQLTDSELSQGYSVIPRDVMLVARARHMEPWREYHSLAHPQNIERTLHQASADGVAIRDPICCAIFTWWHDSIYDPQAPHGRNERLSADLCRSELSTLLPARAIERAQAAILSTISHAPCAEDQCPDIAILLDADLAILGAPAHVFLAYDQAIRIEYGHVPEADYLAGRAAVLRRFLDRERLYLTEWAHALWEAAARENLQRAIARLEDAMGASPTEGQDSTH